MEIGDMVVIAPSNSILDCCQNKRGRIVHRGVGGGWLVFTDHLCPVERNEDELTLIPRNQLAHEKIEATDPQMVAHYRELDSDRLREAMGRGDALAWAILIERGEIE